MPPELPRRRRMVVALSAGLALALALAGAWSMLGPRVKGATPTPASPATPIVVTGPAAPHVTTAPADGPEFSNAQLCKMLIIAHHEPLPTPLTTARYLPAVIDILENGPVVHQHEDGVTVTYRALCIIQGLDGDCTAAIPVVVRYLQHPNPGMREPAVKALGRIGRPGELFLLVPLLEDPSDRAREAAREALERRADLALTREIHAARLARRQRLPANMRASDASLAIMEQTIQAILARLNASEADLVTPTPSPTPAPPRLTESGWSPWLISGLFAGLGLLSLVLLVVLFRRRRA